jgi:hypothetical protein
MIQLHDMALLARRLSATDWHCLLTPPAPRAASWWALPPLQLLRRYYPRALPANIGDALQAKCPALLKVTARRRRLADVSVSNPRRPLFPALLWAATLPEACRFMTDRVRRGAQALRGSGALPQATELQPWIERAHRQRTVDVLLGRPRPETVMMLAAALSNDPSFAADYEQPNVA